jgi:hypothetical protein
MYDAQPDVHLVRRGSAQLESLEILDPYELEVLALLCFHRRTLPVYREGIWYCFDCNYYSADIAAVSRHLLTEHEPFPPDDLDDEDPFMH